jgi:uncharacterized protein (TIGR03084 family)
MEQICTDLAAEHDVLDGLVDGLTEDEWRRATPAEGWDVADTVVHIAFFDDAARLAVVDRDRFEQMKNQLLAGDIDIDEIARSRSGTEILGWWRETRSGLVSALRPLEPKARVAWFGPPMGARSFATARLMETWSHGQDVAAALHRPYPSTDRLRHIAHLGVVTRGWSYLNRGMQPPDAPVRVELVAPSGEQWAWGAEDATDTVRGTAVEFCLVVTQRRPYQATNLEVTGPAATEWMSVAQAFAGPPTLTDQARVASH